MLNIRTFIARLRARRSMLAQTLELSGFTSVVSGVGVQYGLGPALFVGGIVAVFVASFGVDR